MRYQSYINTAAGLIQRYDGSIPLAHYLKQYFSQHKKHGSKDRKQIAHLCYCYYRLGRSIKEIPLQEGIRIALFLVDGSAGVWSEVYEASWLAHWDSAIQVRIDFVRSCYPSFSVAEIFPWNEQLSDGIEQDAFALSHLIQPDLFLRIRPGKATAVLQKLTTQQINYTSLSATCLSFPNASKIDTVIDIDKEAVVQDYSSQRISEFLTGIGNDKPLQVWDACAASGGKSILIKDFFKQVQLTVSDIRPSILHNLKARFHRAGIEQYHSFVADLSKPLPSTQLFNLIVCDVPCSGSGTWSRTPEQLFFFKEEKINEYQLLQQRIVANAIPHLKKEGYFLYITCSVFAKENEAQIAFLQKQFGLQLVRMELLKGYEQKADSMFAVLLKSG
jgi:16S rRNA (cytosine967-C5)-methyltransferase